MSGEIQMLLAQRHPMDRGEWVNMPELRNGTGWSADRSVDFFAMSMWKSSNYVRVAYEIKVSRGDFRREIDQPGKRAWAMEVSHQFYFVAPPDVINPDEVPDDCGLLVVSKAGDKLRRVKVARHRTPRVFTESEVCSLLRGAAALKESPLFQYLGQPITDKELIEIARKQRSKIDEKDIADRVNVKMAETVEALRYYAEELQAAGCEPPPWMLENGRPDGWKAQEWVRKNVAPGPGAAALQDSLAALKKMSYEITRAYLAVEGAIGTEKAEAAP